MDWAVYRSGIAVDDGAPAPTDVVIDASRMPSAVGMQLWITPVRTAGAGTITLTVVREAVGSMVGVQPYKTVATAAAVATLSENKFTGLMPGVYHVLATGITPGATWDLHYTLTSGLGVVVPAGGAATWGAIAGVLANQLDLAAALSSAGGTATWGSVGGTLSSQTDLNDALNLRQVIIPTSKTVYVRTDGNDANDGSANDAAHAWLTIQRAVNIISTYIIPTGVTVTIQVGDGTYVENVILHRFAGGGAVIVNGNTGTPANVVVTGNVRATENSVGYSVQAFRVAPSSGGSALLIDRKAIMTMGTGMIIAGTVTTAHIVVNSDGYLRISGNYTVASSAPSHWYVTRGSVLEITTSITMTITGTPAWSSAFLSADTGASVVPYGLTVSGSSTGVRYSIALNAVCQTFGGGASYLPGNSAGSTSTGGQYA